MEKISVIIVNWNVAKFFVRCVKSVLSTGYSNLELILIDNASNSKPSIPKDKRITFIQNKSNIGLSRAWNQGLRKATGEFILILNPDAIIPPDFFTEVVQFIKLHPRVGIVGPKFVNTDGTPQGSVFSEASIIGAIRQYWLNQGNFIDKYTPSTTYPLEVNSVSGACMFFPKSTLDAVGPFTEEVFMYFEDMDFNRRVRQAGLKVVYHPGLVIFHNHGKSAQQTSPDKYRNFLEILIYPLRKFLNIPNTLPSAQRYRTEAGIWYNGWLKQLVIAFIIWSGQKWKNFLKEN